MRRPPLTLLAMTLLALVFSTAGVVLSVVGPPVTVTVTVAGASPLASAPRPTCSRAPASWPVPSARATYAMAYVPPRCDVMHSLPRQAWRVFACIRWAESRDQVHEASVNGDGLYQFVPSTWRYFAPVAWVNRWPRAYLAPATVQDRVAARAFRVEQFYAWRGDPCVGWPVQLGKFGWWP